MNKVYYLCICLVLFGFVVKGQHFDSYQVDGQFSFYVGDYDRPKTSRFMSQRDTLNVSEIGFSLTNYYSKNIVDNYVQLNLISGIQINYGYIGIFAESYLEELGISSFQDQYLGEINPTYLGLSIPVGLRAKFLKAYVQLEILNNIHLWKPRSLIFDGSHLPIRNSEVRKVIEDHYASYFRRFYNSSSLQIGFEPDTNVVLGYHMTLSITNRFKDLENDKYAFSFGAFLNYTFKTF